VFEILRIYVVHVNWRCEMGGGDFGSDGSVHWNVRYGDKPGDPVDHMDYDNLKEHPGKPSPGKGPFIGDGKAGKGLFRVTIRCKNAADAAKMLKDATTKQESTGASDVILDFPIKNYRPNPPDEMNRNEWEISVDW
jgi:hypothetical protein